MVLYNMTGNGSESFQLLQVNLQWLSPSAKQHRGQPGLAKDHDILP